MELCCGSKENILVLPENHFIYLFIPPCQKRQVLHTDALISAFAVASRSLLCVKHVKSVTHVTHSQTPL